MGCVRAHVWKRVTASSMACCHTLMQFEWSPVVILQGRRVGGGLLYSATVCGTGRLHIALFTILKVQDGLARVVWGVREGLKEGVQLMFL